MVMRDGVGATQDATIILPGVGWRPLSSSLPKSYNTEQDRSSTKETLKITKARRDAKIKGDRIRFRTQAAIFLQLSCRDKENEYNNQLDLMALPIP